MEQKELLKSIQQYNEFMNMNEFINEFIYKTE